MNWRTKVEYMDEETAEVLKKNSLQKGDYVITKTTKYFKKDGNINERISVCRRFNKRN